MLLLNFGRINGVLLYCYIKTEVFTTSWSNCISVVYPRRTSRETQKITMQNSLGLACGPKHIGNSPHMIRNNAKCEKLNCFEAIKRRQSKNFIFRFVFYYSFDRKDGIQSGRRWHHSSFYSGGIKSWVYI